MFRKYLGLSRISSAREIIKLQLLHHQYCKKKHVAILNATLLLIEHRSHIIGYFPCYLRFTNHPTQHYLSINKVVSVSKQVEKIERKY